MPEGKPEVVFEVTEKEGVLVQHGKIKVPYTWVAGEVASRFLVGLRDEKKIYGKRCPECGMVLVPPKKVCHRCFVPTTEWVEVSDEGTLESFTIVRYYDPAIHLREVPFAYGIIKLDGADTGIVHFVGGADLARLNEGQRVKAVFREKGEGNYLDIEYFKPIQGGK